MNAIITGGSQGIGLALTEQLLAKGWSVWAVSRKIDLSELKRKYPGKLQTAPLDVTSDASVKEFVQSLDPRMDLDLLVNNAGMLADQDKDITELSLKEVETSFLTNAVGTLRVTQALIPFLKRSPRAKIANISSLMGSIGDNQSGSAYGYRISKAAVNMISKNLAIDLPEMTVLTLHPGWVQTAMGGKQAPVRPADSARGLLEVIEATPHEQSGSFLDFEGDSLPW